MAMVDVDGSSHLSADSQPKLVGLVWGLVATLCSVCIHQINRVNSRSDCGHEDSTINMSLIIIIIVIIINPNRNCKMTKSSPLFDETHKISTLWLFV